uniref:Alcohol dehydrogenase-like 2 n=1 Tax=Cajanus cajan TaxID=3821 RepID=A0A151QQ99_CAJCA|nr:Alcohol dehydrogenase-like 2 [Cajanus cajan]
MPREVWIRIICSSLYHSDITFRDIQDPLAIFPRVLGHEATGVMESIGKDVTEVTKGDLVVPVILPECGECINYKSTKSNRCTNFPFNVSPWMPRDGTTRFTDQNGDIIYHFLFISSFSEYTVVDIANLIKIDPEIPPNRACLFGCGKKFGVTDFVNAGECGNKPIIIEKTGTGADYCFECVGMASLILEAYASCRMGWGKTIVLGVDRPGAKINLNSHDVLHDGKSLMGSLFGGLKPKSHVPILLKRYVDKLDEFVTHEVEFKDINKAFDLLSKGQCL